MSGSLLGFFGLAFVTMTTIGCGSQAPQPVAPPENLPLVAGVGEHIVSGTGSVSCTVLDAEAKARAEEAALEDAVGRAVALYGVSGVTPSIANVVSSHRVERQWESSGRCAVTLQAVVRTDQLRDQSKQRTRNELEALGRPLVALAIQSYRILPNLAVTTRRSAAEVIDSLQQELITRGFDVRRALGARRKALAAGGEEVIEISSAEREDISAAARKEGVAFLIQGEIKVSDEGKKGDGDYLAVVDGSLEVVELGTDRVVGGFRDVAQAKHISASAAYTKAISGFARAAGAELAPQMLDTWRHLERPLGDTD